MTKSQTVAYVKLKSFCLHGIGGLDDMAAHCSWRLDPKVLPAANATLSQLALWEGLQLLGLVCLLLLSF